MRMKLCFKPLRILAVVFLFIGAVANGSAEESEDILKRRIITDKSDYVSMVALGNIYKDKGNRKAAMRLLKDAIEIAPDYPMSHFYLGQLYFLMQKADDAIVEFHIFTSKMNSLQDIDEGTRNMYISSLYYICDVCYSLKRYEEFKSYIDEMLKLNSKEQGALYNLGLYYYVYGHNRSKAYESFMKALDIDPYSNVAKKAKYAIEYIRNNPDSRVIPDFSFIDQEFRE